MSKNEIRLRRQKITARGAERFRNYGAVLHRVEEEKRIRKILRVFGYFLVILILIMLLVIVIRLERKSIQSKSAPKQTTSVQIRRSDNLIAVAQRSLLSPLSSRSRTTTQLTLLPERSDGLCPTPDRCRTQMAWAEPIQ